MKRNVEEVSEKYYDFIYKNAYLKLKNNTDAEDIVQEVLEKYLKSKGEFNDEEHEKRWIMKVTMNLCKNLAKSPWKTRVIPIENYHIQFKTEKQYRMLEELKKLDEKYRVVIQLFYYQDLSIERISKILNISSSNVRVRLNRARNELKINVDRRDIFDD